jgi:hypothetical protein
MASPSPATREQGLGNQQDRGDQGGAGGTGKQTQGRQARTQPGQEAYQQRQEQHVPHRVGQRDEPAQPAEVVAAGGRRHQEDPGEEAEADGHDGGVDPAHPVPSGCPRAHQQHQAEADQRAAGEVEGVGQRRERGRAVQHPLIQRVDEVAGGDAGQPAGQHPPQPRPPWPVQADPDEQPGHAGQADGGVRARLPPVVGQQEVADDRRRPDHQIGPPRPGSHAFLISGTRAELTRRQL